jgi:hypothetical protein
MSESPEARARRRWINLGELIALAALIVSALGVWIAWKSTSEDKPTRVVEQRQPIPLTLRAMPNGDGSILTIVPTDPNHGLESLRVTIKGASPIEIGSDGRLQASDVQAALKDRPKEEKDRTFSVPVRIVAHYVEMGTDKRGGGSYVLRYRWEGGGLFGGRSIKLVGLSR